MAEHTKVFSFSTKTKEDADFILYLKTQIKSSGGSFSFEVIKALKAYNDSKKANHD